MASFAPLSQRTLPEAAVLPWRACNPAMDLVLVAGRLWRMVDASSSGSAKVWEHPGDKELPIEWAPDGKYFVQLKDSALAVCSVHSGLSLVPPVPMSFKCSSPTMLRWGQALTLVEALDDVIFARLNTSIPQPLPLPKPETSSISTASALFARQNTPAKPSKELKRPQIPALTSDIPYNSLVVVVNESEAHVFLGGSLPLGQLALPPSCIISSSSIYPFEQPQLTLFAFNKDSSHLSYHTYLIDIANPSFSKFSRASTRLQFYLNHCLESLEVSISHRNDGLAARDDFITKWSQSAFRSHPTPHQAVIAEILMLLLTGRPSESFQVHFSSKLAERGFNKWNESMSQSLTSLRQSLIDHVIPSLENIIVWLKQTQAWIECLENCGTDTGAMQASESISAAISLAFKALICASDASLQARLEIGSLENFTRWLRYEIQKSSEEQRNSEHELPKPNIDVYRAVQFVQKELKNPLLDDLLESEKVIITSPNVQHSSQDPSAELKELIKEKKHQQETEMVSKMSEGSMLVSMSMDEMSSTMDTSQQQQEQEQEAGSTFHSPPSKGLILLLDDLASLLKDIFDNITKELLKCITTGPVYSLGLTARPCIIRDYASKELQYLAFTTEETSVKRIHLIRIQDAKPQEATATSIELCPNNNEEYVTLLDFGLFDDIEFGILYTYGGEHFLSTINLSTLNWNTTHPAQQLFSSSQSTKHPMTLYRSHRLGPPFVPKYLALNGRQGRRVGCVLGADGRSMQVFDMETDVDEEDVDDNQDDNDGIQID